jgi:hypothetical protein
MNPSLHECLFPQVLAIFDENQRKLLSMNTLRIKRGAFNQA